MILMLSIADLNIKMSIVLNTTSLCHDSNVCNFLSSLTYEGQILGNFAGNKCTIVLTFAVADLNMISEYRVVISIT